LLTGDRLDQRWLVVADLEAPIVLSGAVLLAQQIGDTIVQRVTATDVVPVVALGIACLDGEGDLALPRGARALGSGDGFVGERDRGERNETDARGECDAAS